MSKKVVYAAGPISGCTYEECVDWRDGVTRKFASVGIAVASPMRSKQYLADRGVLDGDYPEHTLSTQHGIVARDYFDVHRCDLLLVNLLGAKKVSIGTMYEMAWAFHKRTPVVLAMEPGNVHDHPFVRAAAPFIVGTLDEAVAVAVSVLSPV